LPYLLILMYCVFIILVVGVVFIVVKGVLSQRLPAEEQNGRVARARRY